MCSVLCSVALCMQCSFVYAVFCMCGVQCAVCLCVCSVQSLSIYPIIGRRQHRRSKGGDSSVKKGGDGSVKKGGDGLRSLLAISLTLLN